MAAAISPASSAIRCCCTPERRTRGARTADRPWAQRATFGRKQYRKAVQVAAQALAKTGAADAAVYLALEQPKDLDEQYRARIVAESFLMQRTRSRTSRPAPSPRRRASKLVNLAVRARGREGR
jgi:hypothetical protein